MPNSPRETVLCRYHYDPLDRQNGCTVLEQPVIQRFHCKSRLTTEIQGAARWSILQHDDQLLAQQNHLDVKVSTTLLATDLQRSVLNALDATQANPLAYTPYGYRPAESGLLSLLGFNGERPDPVTGHYHLGNGYRQFNPVLMRFNSPDSWSPFGEGGLNAYAYCEGDPVNRVDPTGHSLQGILDLLRRGTSRAISNTTSTISQEIINTATDIANMKRGMTYKGQTLGYQLGDEASRIKLDNMSVKDIDLHTSVIEKVNIELINKRTALLKKIPDSAEKQRAVQHFESPIQYPTVMNTSSARDKAVLRLHSQAMYFNYHQRDLLILNDIHPSTSPPIQNRSIRQSH
ncbi:RHS repeat-associated core domain-containing protein [Pseudomonas sp. NFX15]|uniref:RHS repeat-associated core domain-containing protein n=1 Tax=Pseudomonas sp. NFX15 TaxID=2816958 RepID=UPI003B8E8DF7